ncbi:hypothetical protein MXMO3_03541 (plasmid) [Maritalea myrionectae]|uniref:Uncharacterized protein n=1 Tax=Maritalea myrionectae TaxID=454601 RepID=A0A2R4MJ94_9HYPH|nr:hypothetical protein [Maritalea myrionectae]AVX06044.1 hypothetical protein MXMO3_03541 [Maritalea myrionectae]
MEQNLPKRMSKGQLELLYLIGENVEPYEIYIRSAMTIERQRVVLSRLIKRFGFNEIDDIKTYYRTHKSEIYSRLEQLNSIVIDPCSGPNWRNEYLAPTEKDLWDAAEILRRLDEAGGRDL